MKESNVRISIPWASVLIIGCRLLAGGVFLAAGVLKIGDHQGMLNAISAYGILPDPLIGPLALLLPALEIAAGAMLILGLSTRSAGALASALLVVFLIALTQAKLRGLEIDCGCFITQSSSPKKGIPWWDIVRDIGLLAASGYVVWRPQGPAALDNLIMKGTEDEEIDEDERQESQGRQVGESRREKHQHSGSTESR
ncbi:MAG: MauE/DoxX family redox-associated membrane protein [Acidobacteriota bacterium]